MLTSTQSAAVTSLLAALTEGQRAALLDVLGSHVENEETRDDWEAETGAHLEAEGHVFLVALRDAVIADLDAAAVIDLPTFDLPAALERQIATPRRPSTKRAGPQSTNRDDAAIAARDNQRVRQGTR